MRRPRHPVRHHHQRLAHVGRTRTASTRPTRAPSTCSSTTRRATSPRLNLMKFVQRGRRVRRRGVPVRRQGDDHGAGDPGRQRQLPDAEDRGEQPPLPAARPGLRQPRRAADEPRPGLRLGRGSHLRGGHHRDHARRGLSPERGHRARPRRRRSSTTTRTETPFLRVIGKHRDAAYAIPDRRACPRRCSTRHGDLGRRPGAGHAARLPQRAGDRARADRHDRVHDGLRYHRHRARHRAHQVQEARRRGLPQDRQPDGPGGAAQARLLTRPRSRRSSTTSTSARRSRARPA